MKALVVADVESRSLWDFYNPSKVEGVNVVFACGDLDKNYLEFLATVVNKPVFYVRGNHDYRYHETPPEGCICVEDTIYDFHGLRIMGLGGSMKYGVYPDMYTEAQMAKRIRKLAGLMMFMNGFDVLLAHAPCLGHGDLEDLPHMGFDCFNDLLLKQKPAYMFHGHVHQEYGGFVRERIHESGTKIINGYDHVIVDLPDACHPAHGATGNGIYDWYVKTFHR